MCNKTVDDFLLALKFVPDCFVRRKMVKKRLTALYADKNILCFNKNSDDAVFPCNKMGILSIDLNIINLDDTNFGEDDPKTTSCIRILAYHIKIEKHKTVKKRVK